MRCVRCREPICLGPARIAAQPTKGRRRGALAVNQGARAAQLAAPKPTVGPLGEGLAVPLVDAFARTAWTSVDGVSAVRGRLDVTTRWPMIVCRRRLRPSKAPIGSTSSTRCSHNLDPSPLEWRELPIAAPDLPCLRHPCASRRSCEWCRVNAFFQGS
jgi:hypothetical protein